MNTTSEDDPAERDHNNRESLQQSLREWLRFGMEIVALVALVCYVRATQNQVATAKDANKIPRDALISGERPWVALTHLGELKDYRIGAMPTVGLTIQNSGKTPAIHVRAKSGMGIFPSKTFVFRDIMSSHTITERHIGTLFPGHTAENSVGIWIPLQDWEIVQQDTDDAPEVIVFGLITYEDGSGGVHHTPICERYHPATVINGKEIIGGGFLSDRSCATDSTIPYID